jgi:hypothetical protein
MTANSPLILIVSRADDLPFISTCRKVLEIDGYRTVLVGTLGLAASLALKDRVSLIIVGKSFTPVEQEAFIDCLHESHSDIPVLCLSHSIVPRVLVDGCKLILASHPGAANVYGLEYRRAS